jgi:hypothetical protein
MFGSMNALARPFGIPLRDAARQALGNSLSRTMGAAAAALLKDTAAHR